MLKVFGGGIGKNCQSIQSYVFVIASTLTPANAPQKPAPESSNQVTDAEQVQLKNSLQKRLRQMKTS
ncbi:MAG: hypothetical protein C4549_02585 [Deltaproteobacteria bacterium]|jgi:hypothetical protein|nr:MAG: hypothetical protein C4549_02585 [Deltaproteobacteria bacterium]